MSFSVNGLPDGELDKLLEFSFQARARNMRVKAFKLPSSWKELIFGTQGDDFIGGIPNVHLLHGIPIRWVNQ